MGKVGVFNVLALCAEKNDVGVLTVPDDAAHHSTNGNPLLLVTHLVNAVFEHGQHFAHHIKLNIAEGVFGCNADQFFNAHRELVDLQIHFAHAVNDSPLGSTFLGLGKGVHKGVDLLFKVGFFFSHSGKTAFIFLPIAGVEHLALFYLSDEIALFVPKAFYLLDDCCVQSVAVDIAMLAKLLLAPFLHLTNVGVDGFAISGLALGQTGVHPIAAGAEYKTGKQRLILSGTAIGF